jgi:hypothetical protein
MSEAALLRWCGAQLRESGVSVENFGASFASGEALCHIVHRIGGDASVARAAVEKREPAGNVRAALAAAKKLGVDDVVTADDVLNGDAALVVTLVAALFRAARSLQKDAEAAGSLRCHDNIVDVVDRQSRLVARRRHAVCQVRRCLISGAMWSSTKA